MTPTTHLTTDRPSAPVHRRRARSWFGLPLVAALAVSLAACGSDEPGTVAAADPVTPTTEAETTTTEAGPHEGPIDLVGADFRFEGVPATVAAGHHRITFENQGTETHEVFMFRNPDGLSLEEIAALGPAGAPEAVDLVAFLLAEPGKTGDPVDADLTPGDYVVACFIATPTDGRHHFEHGMQAAFTVV